jgi:hypothetical protein
MSPCSLDYFADISVESVVSYLRSTLPGKSVDINQTTRCPTTEDINLSVTVSKIFLGGVATNSDASLIVMISFRNAVYLMTYPQRCIIQNVTTNWLKFIFRSDGALLFSELYCR